MPVVPAYNAVPCMVMVHARRLPVLYAAAFAQAFILWYAIEKLFMRGLGFDDASIAVAVTIMSATTLLAEIPSGVLADRWSRKGVLMLSNAALVLSTLLGAMSTGPVMYTCALVLLGVYFALYSGTYDSIIYDTTLEQDGDSKRYRKRFGTFQILSGIALLSSSVIGSSVGQMFGLRWAYWLTLPFGLLSIVLLLFFKEPRLHKASAIPTLGRHLISSIRHLLQQRTAPAVLATVLVGIGMGLLFSFGQLWYLAVALPLIFYGPAYAALQACLVFGGLAGGRFRLRLAPLIGALALGTAALAVPSATIVIAGQIVMQTALVILMIHLSSYVHDQVSSYHRSGITSVLSTLTKLASLPVGLLFGYVSRQYSVFATPLIIVALLAALAYLLWRIRGALEAHEDTVTHAGTMKV